MKPEISSIIFTFSLIFLLALLRLSNLYDYIYPLFFLGIIIEVSKNLSSLFKKKVNISLFLSLSFLLGYISYYAFTGISDLITYLYSYLILVILSLLSLLESSRRVSPRLILLFSFLNALLLYFVLLLSYE